jgi:Ran GTPase-activating protein (RanGAP) involved in mRNA processing and transport
MAMLAQQMLSFERRNRIEPPSATRAQELRARRGAAVAAEARRKSDQHIPRGHGAKHSGRRPRVTGAVALQKPDRPTSLPELHRRRSSPPPTSQDKLHRKKAQQVGASRRGGNRGGRSLAQLEALHRRGKLSKREYLKAKGRVLDSVSKRLGSREAPLSEAEAATTAEEGRNGEGREEDEPRIDMTDQGAAGKGGKESAGPFGDAAGGGVNEEEADDDKDEDEDGEETGTEAELEPEPSTSIGAMLVHARLNQLLPSSVDVPEVDWEELPPLSPGRGTTPAPIDRLPPFKNSRQIAMEARQKREGGRLLSKSRLVEKEALATVRPETAASDDIDGSADDVAADGLVARPEHAERRKLRHDLARLPSRGRMMHDSDMFDQQAAMEDFDLRWAGPVEQRSDPLDVHTKPPAPAMPMVEPATSRQFFGGKSRQAFWELTATQSRHMRAEGLLADPDNTPDSARRHYLRQCELNHVVPLPILIGKGDRNEQPSSVIDLDRRRLGNTTGSAYAGALLRMARQGVQVNELHLRENNLQGRGVIAMAAVVHTMANLRVLDLSENNLGGEAAASLATALASHLTLQQLHMSNCRLEDKDGAVIINALTDNDTVAHLDMSRNRLGSVSLQRSEQSAPAALTKLLAKASAAQIGTLNLSYNNLSPKHFEPIAESLRFNNSLKQLNLSWNNVGCEGAMPLAEALRHNKALNLLDLTHTHVAERGTMVLADMLKENHGLDKLILDDNTIGERGGRAVMRALRKIVQHGWTKDISVLRANTTLRDDSQVDFATLTDVNATKRANDPENRDLKPDWQSLPCPLFDPTNAAGHYSLDLDDPYERMVAWELVELAWEEKDENWENEMLDGQPYDLEEPGPGEIWSRDDFQLPDTGILTLVYHSSTRVKRFSDVMDIEMLYRLIDMMSGMQSEKAMNLLRLAGMEFWFTAEYVGILLQVLPDGQARVEAMSFLLMRIVDHCNITAECFDLLTDSEMKHLEQRVGQLLYFTPTNPTGHYKLELGNRFERIMIQRILEIATEEEIWRRDAEGGSRRVDTSQHGDFENFRNETQDKRAADFDTDDFARGEGCGARYGLLEFDYVSTNAHHRLVKEPPMPDSVFDLFSLELYRVRSAVGVVVSAKATTKGSRSKKFIVATKMLGRSRSATVAALAKAQLETEPEPELEPEPEPEPEPEQDPAAERTSRLIDMIMDKMGADVMSEESTAALASKLEALEDHELRVQAEEIGVDAETLAEMFLEDDQQAAELRAVRIAQKYIRLKLLRKMVSTALAAAKDIKLRKQQLSQNVDQGSELEQDHMAEILQLISGTGKRKRQLSSAERNCWWIPRQKLRVTESSVNAREASIGHRQLLMLRRSTLQWYFSKEQVKKLLEVIQVRFHVEALIILFGRIVDIECCSWTDFLGHVSFDRDGNGFVTEEELREIANTPWHYDKSASDEDSEDEEEAGEEGDDDIPPEIAAGKRWLELQRRIGPVNLFNPMQPEGEYCLNLFKPDERRVAQLLVILMSEPGKNLTGQSYNGYPFDVGPSWEEEVPHIGMFCTAFKTPEKWYVPFSLAIHKLLRSSA